MVSKVLLKLYMYLLGDELFGNPLDNRFTALSLFLLTVFACNEMIAWILM